MIQLLSAFSIILFLASCTITPTSLLQEKLNNAGENKGPYKYYADGDFVDHLTFLGKVYIENKEIKRIELSNKAQIYLNSIFQKLASNNELLIKSLKAPQFHIIKEDIPFHFSLPKGEIFLSLGLLKKYIKHEGILISILSYEFIKSTRTLYNANVIVPTGYISTKRLIALTRIPFNDKMQINKWAFYAMKRSGFDPYSYLTWIQLQNKNTLDFSMNLGDLKNMAKEEYEFKAFMIERGLDNKIGTIIKNSSADFYQFIEEVKKIES